MEMITTDTPAARAAEELSQVLHKHTDKPILLMLSGGSALSILDHVDATMLGPHQTITTLDERYSTDPASNNFAQIAATNFYEKAVTQGVQTITTVVGTDETLAEAGERFNAALHNWKDTYPNGVVITTIGVGPDGHTAGIFPNQSTLGFKTDDWVVAYELAPNTNPHTSRITVTPTFLKTQVDSAIAFITGEAKRVILNRLQDPQCSSNDIPACLIKDMQKVVIVTDLQ